MPDYFVPLDTTQYTPLHRQLAAKSIIINANLKYVDNNRKKLQKEYPTFADFNRRYEVPQSLIDEILAEGERQKATPKDSEERERTVASLKTQLKALVARDLWDMSEYFQVINETNPIVQKAVQLFAR